MKKGRALFKCVNPGIHFVNRRQCLRRRGCLAMYSVSVVNCVVSRKVNFVPWNSGCYACWCVAMWSSGLAPRAGLASWHVAPWWLHAAAKNGTRNLSFNTIIHFDKSSPQSKHGWERTHSLGYLPGPSQGTYKAKGQTNWLECLHIVPWCVSNMCPMFSVIQPLFCC